MNLKENITKVIKNMQKIPQDNCESVLGSDYGLVEVSKVWENTSGYFHLIAAYIIYKKMSKKGISSDDLDNYKEGIADLLKFLEDF